MIDEAHVCSGEEAVQEMLEGTNAFDLFERKVR